MLETGLDWRFFFLWGSNAQKRLYSFPKVVDGWRADPEEIAIYLQWPSVFVVNEDAYWKTLDLFRFEHASKALLEIRPHKKWLPILNLYLLRHSAAALIRCIDLYLKKFLYSSFINPQILRQVDLVKSIQFDVSSIVIVAIGYN